MASHLSISTLPYVSVPLTTTSCFATLSALQPINQSSNLFSFLGCCTALSLESLLPYFPVFFMGFLFPSFLGHL
uniref:Uncharacterized protein n=1 Tax=Rhizophora mucronata TaxID=61149 RepID=A0A2P2QSC6_RHIMU